MKLSADGAVVDKIPVKCSTVSLVLHPLPKLAK